MPLKRLAPLLIIAALIGILLTGCWNRREPEFLGVVLAVGFDYNPENNLYRVIAQLDNPVSIGGESPGGNAGGGGGNGKEAFWTIAAEGHTPFESIRNLIETSSRALFWAHCRVVLFSEELARRGIRDVLDLFERDREFRLIVKPVVVKGDLHEIMEAHFQLEETGASGLDRLIMTTLFERSIFPDKNLNELIATLSQPGKEMFIGQLEVLESQENSGSENNGAGSAPPARIGGGALFRGDRMVGWIDNKQAQGWAYATGRASQSNFLIKTHAREDHYASIETFGHSARMYLQGDEENWQIELKVKLKGRLQEYYGPEKLDENELIRNLNRRAAAEARNHIEAMFSHSKELKADVFGFGNLIHRKNPRLWQKIGSRWDEEIYPQLEIKLTVEFSLMRSGLVYNPLREEQ